jgi:hypothetical protein
MKQTLIGGLALIYSSCATMSESMQLGASLGAGAGASSIWAARASSGAPTSGDQIAIGAAVGAGVGILTSYLVHRSVEAKRQALQSEDFEMHFGDLPPSPFVLPKSNPFKKGVR